MPEENAVVEEVEDKEFTDAFAEFSKDDDFQYNIDSPKDEEVLEEEPKKEDDNKVVEPEKEESGIWGSATPEQLEYVKSLEESQRELEHKHLSNNGRISALQKKIDSMAEDQSAKKPTDKEVSEAIQDESRWGDFVAEYPEIAKTLDSRLKHEREIWQQELKESIKPHDEKIARLVQSDEEDQLKKDIAALEAVHPDWLKTSEDIEFNTWLKKQPHAIQGMRHSDSVEDVSYLLTLYKGPNKEPAGAPAGDQGGEDSPDVASIQRKREERMRQAEAPAASQTGGDRPVSSDDFGGAFTVFSKRKTKEQRR